MMRIMMKSKIHRATVTQADLHYVGSVTLDAALMEAADLLEGEQVAIVDIANGARIETYVIPGPSGSGVIGINGAAAHLVHPGDLVIIMSYAVLGDAEARDGVDQGVFSVPHVHQAVTAVLTMCAGIPLWFRPEGPLTAQQVADDYGVYALNLVGYRPS